MQSNVRTAELCTLILAPLGPLLVEVQRLLDMTVDGRQAALEQEEETTAKLGTGSVHAGVFGRTAHDLVSQPAGHPPALARGAPDAGDQPSSHVARSLDRGTLASAPTATRHPPLQAVNAPAAAAPQGENSIPLQQPVEEVEQHPDAVRAAIQGGRPAITTAGPGVFDRQNRPVITIAPRRSSPSTGLTGSAATATPQGDTPAVSKPSPPTLLPEGEGSQLLSPGERIHRHQDKGKPARNPDSPLYQRGVRGDCSGRQAPFAPSKSPPAPLFQRGELSQPAYLGAYGERDGGESARQVSRPQGIPLLPHTGQSTVGHLAAGLEPVLEQAYQLSRSTLDRPSSASQTESETPVGQVNNTFNVTVAMASQPPIAGLDRETLQDALVEILRVAARRQGLEV